MSDLYEAECLRNYTNLVHNYNKLFEKNSNLKRQHANLQITFKTYVKDFEEKRKFLLNNIQNRIQREKTDSKKIETLQYKLYEEEDEVIKLTQQLNLVIGVMNKIQGYLQRCTKNACENQENGDLNSCQNLENDNCNIFQNHKDGGSNICQNQEDENLNTYHNEEQGTSNASKNQEDRDSHTCSDQEEGDSNASQNQEDRDSHTCSDQEGSDSNTSQNQENGISTTCKNHKNEDLDTCQNNMNSNISVSDKCSSEWSSINTKSSYENESLAERFVPTKLCSYENKPAPERLSATTQWSWENKPVPERCSKNTQTKCEIDSIKFPEKPINICEHSGCGDRQQLLCEIQKWYDTMDLHEPIKLLLKRSKIAIHCLIKYNNTQSTILKRYEDDRKCYTKRLHEELDKSKNKDFEISTMRDDLKYLSNYLCRNQNENFESSLSKVLDELYCKTEAYNELLKKTEEQNEELQNMKYCLNMRIDENKTLKRDIHEKNNEVNNYVQVIQSLECNINSAEQKFKESETLKDICNDRCNDLTTQNLQLKKDLDHEKTENCERKNEITELCDQMRKFESVIKGFECQKALDAKEFTKLKEEKCVVIQKFVGEIDELNCVIQMMRNELAITKSENACAQEYIQKIDKENECLNEKVSFVQSDVENLEKQLQHYKCENDAMTKKYLINEIELSESKTMIEILETRTGELNCQYENNLRQVSLLRENMDALQCELKETVKKNQELTSNCLGLEKENCELATKNDELFESVFYAKKMENIAQNNLIICKEKLMIAANVNSNLKLEIECLEKKLNKKITEQTCIEKKLQGTICKLNEETELVEEINANHSVNISNDLCQMTNSQVPDNCKTTSNNPPCCLKSVVCQTELNEEYNKCLLEENKRLTGENMKLCKTTQDLEESVQKLYNANVIFEQSIKDMTAKNQIISKSSVDVGLQICLCPVICQSQTVVNQCESECNNCPNDWKPNNNIIHTCDSTLKTFSQCSCPSDDCSCYPDQKMAKKCDCIANFLEKKKLQCQLTEIQHTLNEKEKSIKKLLCDTERKHYKSMEENKSHFLKKIKELEAQLETYETTILYREKDLKCCKLKEEKLNTDIEKLKETIKIKDKHMEYEQNKVVSLTNNLNSYKKKYETLQEEFEVEKSNKQKLDQQLNTMIDRYNTQQQKIKDLESHLIEVEKEAEKYRKCKAKNNGKCTQLKKKTKTGCETKWPTNLTNKLNIPCCIGSKDPCNRQKEMTKRILQDKHQASGMSLEGRLEMYQDKLTTESKAQKNLKQPRLFVVNSEASFTRVKNNEKSPSISRKSKKSKQINSTGGNKSGRPKEKTNTVEETTAIENELCTLTGTCIKSLKQQLQDNVCGDNPNCGQKDCCRKMRFK